MAGQKILHHILVFLGQYRTGAVNQHAAGLYRHCGAMEQLLLQLGNSIYVFGFTRPFDVGLSPYNPEAGARGIKQYPIERSLVFFIGKRRVVQFRMYDTYTEPRRIFFNQLQFMFKNISGYELSGVVHQLRQVRSFAARSTAYIQYGSTRLRCQYPCRQHRAFVLHLEKPVFKGFQPGKRNRGLNSYRLVRILPPLCFNSFILKFFQKFRRRYLQSICSYSQFRCSVSGGQ